MPFRKACVAKVSFTAAIIIALFCSEHSYGQPTSMYPASKHGGNYMFNFYFPPAPSSTPWAPDWSPDGKWIAVAMGGSIWKVNPQTGAAFEMTYNEKYHSSPDWSSDGKWIVYTADDGGHSIQLEVLNTETGESSKLTNDAFIYTDPVFSPDGTRIAYVSTKPNGYFNIYVRSFENGQFTGDELAISKDNNYGNSRLYFGEWDMHISPTWLPSGKELLIISNRDVPLGSGNILRVAVASSGIEEAQTVLREQTLYRTKPDVSIDGKRFIYASTGGSADQFTNLYVQPTVGGEPYKLTFFSHDAFHPKWSPDGEWIAYITNKDGLPQLALLETYGGKQITVKITDRRFRRPMGILSLVTRDENTRKITGSRAHLTASDGKYYAPIKAYARASGVGDKMFHTPGKFTVRLPAGNTQLTITKGFEFWPEEINVEIEPNKVTHVNVDLKRMTNMSEKGWYSGSTHVHMNYAGNLHNTLENLMMMSAAEDQDVVNEQVANKDNRILDYQFFVKGGGPHPLSTSEQILVVGQEYRPPFYGHVFMFGLRDHLISPYTTGYEGTAIESLYPSNTDMFRKARKQGATVGYVHAFDGWNPGSSTANPSPDPLESNLGGAKGFMVDAALGTTDAVEWSNSGLSAFYPVYAAWNNGLKVTAVGGEDSISNLHRSKLVGSARTYVYTGEHGLDMKAWFKGLRDGKAFVSTGPIVELTVNHSIPGETISLPAGGSTVRIEGHVQSITPLSKVTLMFNGKMVEEIALDANRKTASFNKSYSVRQSGWYHLRAEGDASERFPLDTNFAQAFTNPIWVIVGDAPVRSREAAEYSIRWIDKLRGMAEDWPGWRSQKEKDHVFAQFNEARKIFEKFASEAP